MDPTKLNRNAAVLVAAITLGLTLGTMTTSAGPNAGKTLSVAAGQIGQAGPLAPVGSGFTYQGSLKNGGNPANGQYDFTFKLFDALSAGNQVGSTVTVANQTVTGGLFTVQLDFGAAAFRGDARWLEIAVRTAGGGTYTTLSPRQPLSATPYASSLVPGSTLTNNSSSNLVTVNNTGTGAGMYGESAGGVGVRGVGNNQHGGLFTNNSTIGYAALQGIANGTPGYGIYGEGNSIGIWGSTTNGTGVRGATTGGYGVHGYSVSTGTGVRGESPSSYGVHGISTSSTGVRGESNTGDAVHGIAGGYGRGVLGTSIDGKGVYGASSTNEGVRGDSNSYVGVRGSSLSGTGVVGQTEDSTGESGVLGVAPAGSNGVRGQGGNGVYGVTVVNNGVGVRGDSPNGYGVYGVTTGSGYAGYFTGRVHVTGNLSKGAGSFKIDHPLDPENKYLYHSFVESPDMMNVYNGNVTLDAKGEAVVTMPEWFEALNKEFRYQLTPIGAPGPNLYVAEEVRSNRFKIAGGTAGMKVSWQVTGIRKDAYAEEHRIPVEEVKPQEERGKYLHPTEHGQPESKGIGYEERQRMTEERPKPPEPKP